MISIRNSTIIDNNRLLLILSIIFIINIYSNLAINDQTKPCDINENCTVIDSNQFCFQGVCTCKPNYVFTNGKCEYVDDCSSDPSICHRLNRTCQQSRYSLRPKCLCPPGQIDDYQINDYSCHYECLSDVDCDFKDPGAECQLFRCRCPANHRRINGSCQPFECYYDEQCFTEGDYYRICHNGTCVCEYDQNTLTKRCTIYWYHLFRLRYYHGRIMKIIFMTITIVPLVFVYCFLSNLRRARSTLINRPAIQRSSINYCGHGPVAIIREKNENYYANIENISKTMSLTSHKQSKQSNSNVKYQRFQ